MRDLTTIFLAADQYRETWSESKVHAVLGFISSGIPGSTSDWETGDESWGRIIVGDIVIAFVNARFPLLIVNTEYEEVGRQCESVFCLCCVSADDFDAKDFSMDQILVQRLFERELSPNLSYEEISINELWWATV